jgi:CheY-like chemotaxis protein
MITNVTSAVQTFELQPLLETMLVRHEKTLISKGVNARLINDSASVIVLQANLVLFGRVFDLVLPNIVRRTNATTLTISARQILTTSKETLLEFQVHHNGAITSKEFSYYRVMAEAQKLIEQLQGKSGILHSSTGISLKFIIKCRLAECCKRSSVRYSVAKLSSKKLLVVEDNEMNQRAITKILGRHGLRYVLLEDGKKAIELLESGERFDLILMDFCLPYMDGFETTRFIRRQLKMSLPVIGMSAAKKVLSDTYKEAGLNEMIYKPFSEEQLIDKINEAFEPSFFILPNNSMTA